MCCLALAGRYKLTGVSLTKYLNDENASIVETTLKSLRRVSLPQLSDNVCVGMLL